MFVFIDPLWLNGGSEKCSKEGSFLNCEPKSKKKGQTLKSKCDFKDQIGVNG